MKRREFFGLLLGLVAVLGRKQPERSNDWTHEILMPHHPPGADPGQRKHQLIDPQVHDWHGNWPILPVYNGPSRDYTITWHNTGINQWPNIS